GAFLALALRHGLATVAAQTIVGTSQKDRIAHMRGSRPRRQAESLTQRAQLSPVSRVTMTLATGHLIEDSLPSWQSTALDLWMHEANTTTLPLLLCTDEAA